MKTNVTYVDAAKFETIISQSKLGLTVSAQKGFIKVAGQRGRAVYVASTKRVGRVDISGFEVAYGQEPHCGVFGNVRQQMDFSQDEAAILGQFEQLLTDLAAQPAVEKKLRAPSEPKADAPKGWSEATLAGRKAKIARHASQA